MKLTLRDYQHDALERIAAAEKRGVLRQLGVAATGLGKAQPVDEPVLTPTGWRPIGELAVGDFVIGSDGRKPSKKQKEAAKKWRLPVDPSWNAGELSDALGAHIARIKTGDKASR